jgi:hypothetical protein
VSRHYAKSRVVESPTTKTRVVNPTTKTRVVADFYQILSETTEIDVAGTIIFSFDADCLIGVRRTGGWQMNISGSIAFARITIDLRGIRSEELHARQYRGAISIDSLP